MRECSLFEVLTTDGSLFRCCSIYTGISQNTYILFCFPFSDFLLCVTSLSLESMLSFVTALVNALVYSASLSEGLTAFVLSGLRAKNQEKKQKEICRK